MSSVLKTIRHLSLKTKLLLWYSVVFFCSALILVGAIYFFAAAELKREANEFLRDETEEFVRQAQARLPDREALRSYLRLEIGEKRWFKPLYRIIDLQSGKVIFSAPEEAPQLPIGAQELESARMQGPDARTVSTNAPENVTYRLQTEYVQSDERRLAFQCGFQFDRLYQRLSRLRLYLSMTVIATMAAAVGGGLFLSRRSVQPVADISRRLRRVRASDLDQRLPDYPADDEIGRLTDSINRMLEKLEESFYYMESFASDVAHQLRTPLATLRCELEVILSQDREIEEYRSTLGSVLDRVQNISQLVEDMLFLARADSANQLPDKAPVDLGALMGSVVSNFNLLAEMEGIDLEIDVEDDATIVGYRKWLNAAFGNMVDNGIKYTPDGGHVWISVRTTDDRVKVSIADDGPGIPEEKLDNIWDRNYRLSQNRNDSFSGCGLGLSITQRVVELHNGEITVESQQGNGTTFKVNLPIRSQDT